MKGLACRRSASGTKTEHSSYDQSFQQRQKLMILESARGTTREEVAFLDIVIAFLPMCGRSSAEVGMMQSEEEAIKFTLVLLLLFS